MLSNSSNAKAGLRRLPRRVRQALGGSIVLVGCGYLAVVFAAYLQTSPAGSPVPDFAEIGQILVRLKQAPASPMERLLQADDGPMNGSGSMRLAFTEASTQWKSITEKLQPAELAALVAEREGERLAVLEWTRSGPDWKAYTSDDFALRKDSLVRDITMDYLSYTGTAAEAESPRRVRVRSLLNDRCVVCHSENGASDKACWFPLNCREKLEPYCRCESTALVQAAPVAISFFGLIPMLSLTGTLFQFTSQPRRVRIWLTAAPCIAIVVAVVCWALARGGDGPMWLLPSSAAFAGLCAMLHVIAALGDLLSKG